MKDCNNISFSPSFFEDEVRDGFYVPTMMKRYWACHLKVLSEISKICSKYSIRWFAMLGTLLGAVRHQGYIPWDDDLDICMMRRDYEKFIEVASDELPDGYVLFNVKQTKGFENYIGRVINHYSIDCGDEHMAEFMGCPYIAGVDIFVLDDVYDDDDLEKDRNRRVTDINKIRVLLDKGLTDDESIEGRLEEIENDNKTAICREDDLGWELAKLSDRIFAEHSSDSAEWVAVMWALIVSGVGLYPKDIFRNIKQLRFENVYIPAPERYDELLTIMYGNYMVNKRGGATHNYPCYCKEEKILADKLGCNPYRYTFSVKELQRVIRERGSKKGTDDLCTEILDTLEESGRLVQDLFVKGDMVVFRQLLESIQELTIFLGTTMEERIPESISVVSKLEEFCEFLYETHESPEDDRVKNLNLECEHICDEVRRFLKERKHRILFLPATARWWDSMSSYYKLLSGDENKVISVLPVPYYLISPDGSTEMISGSDDFPYDVKTVPVTEYDFAHGYADEIVIQIPYDETSTVTRLPKFFYSDNLLHYADKLTYIPHLTPDSPDADDYKAITMLSVLIEQPAVLYADKIILNSEKMKMVYLNRLKELAGEETEEYWNDKIVVKEY